MKVTGPGSGAPPDATGGPEEAQSPASKGFADKIDKIAAASTPAAPGVTDAAKVAFPIGLVADIGADLKAGRITPEAALERVIERVVDQQLGASAPATIRKQVGTALRQALEDDPMLADKVRALSGR